MRHGWGFPRVVGGGWAGLSERAGLALRVAPSAPKSLFLAGIGSGILVRRVIKPEVSGASCQGLKNPVPGMFIAKGFRSEPGSLLVTTSLPFCAQRSVSTVLSWSPRFNTGGSGLVLLRAWCSPSVGSNR